MGRLKNARDDHITRWVLPAASRLLIEGACGEAPTKPLKEMVNIEMGQSPAGDSCNEDGDGVLLIGGPSDLGLKYPEATRWTNSPTKLSKDGDIIICVRATIGEPRWSDGIYCLGRGVAGLRPFDENLDPNFLFRIVEGNENWLRSEGTGTTFKTISKKHIADIKIPIIPIHEQKQISSFLDWLEHNSESRPDFQKAPQLPSKLSKQRRTVARIEDLAAKTEEAQKLRRQAAEETEAILSSAKNALFNEEHMKRWKNTTLGEIADIQSGVTLGRKLRGPTIKLPYLRVANVQDGYLDLNIIKKLEILEDEHDKWQLQSGDILLTEGGDWDKLGRGTVWHGEIENCIHQNHIFRVRVNLDEFDPDYLCSLIGSPYGKSYFQAASKQTTNLATINQRQLKAFGIFYPAIDEQRRIVSRLDELQAQVDGLKKHQVRTAEELDALLPSVLDRAFRGQL